MAHRILPLLVVLFAFTSAQAAEAPANLLEGVDATKLKTQDATVAASAGTLNIATRRSNAYPGFTLAAPAGRWDLSAFEHLAVDVKNTGDNVLTICCRVDNPGADGTINCNTAQTTLNPGQSGTIMVAFVRKPDPASPTLFGMRGYPPGHAPAKSTIDPANINQVLVYVPRPAADHAFQVGAIRPGGTYKSTPQGKAFLPFIDTFGQYMHADWPGKVHSIEELAQHRQDEARELEERPGPADWDPYGGWKSGPILKATGFFRTEKVDGKWWLVDPEGRLFFSHGIDCVGMLDITPLDGRDEWFQDFPGGRAEFQEFIRPSAYALHGYYAGKTPRCFGFAAANLKRKYGSDWKQASAEMAHRRLRSWGLNTVANWSDASIARMRKTPYTATIGWQSKLLEGSQGYWGKFRDVFDPSFGNNLRQRMAAEKGRTAGDPWCLGYFADNEIAWGDEISLATAALLSPADQPAKKAFVDDLKAKYGTIETLNEAWGTNHQSWDALLNFRGVPDKQKAFADLTAFYTRSAEQYFRVIRDTIKQVAPNQLYLGCRFAWVNDRAARAAAKYCDVVSYNLYRRSIADFKFNGQADVPLIVGEFHFGALDRGMFHPGLVKLADQNERARVYKEYVQGALRHPNFVGTHWFQYQDEPTTGRVYDEENYQIGFIDTADTPYRETIDACREVGYSMYPYRSGR